MPRFFAITLLPLLLGLASAFRLPAAVPAFEVKTRVERPPETGTITCCDVICALGRFTFVVPAGWRLEPDRSARKLLLHAPDDTTSLEIAFTLKNPAFTTEISTNVLRQQVQARLPAAAFLADFPCYTASLEGLGFDVCWKPRPNVDSAARLAFVPCPRGALEFCLITTPERFRAGQSVFGAVLTSFSQASEPDPVAHSTEHGTSTTAL